VHDISNHDAKREKVTVYNILEHTDTIRVQASDNITILWYILARRQSQECIEVSPKY
jgi:hypothetical protein